MTAWTYLIIAGIFETGFATCLKLEERNSNWIWGFLICAAISFNLLSLAIKTLPIGTAYAVWTGIGAVGTTLVGRFLFNERLGRRKLALLGVMLAAIIGLRLTS